MCKFVLSLCDLCILLLYTWALPTRLKEKKEETTPFEKTNQRG
jgi:hypothetical protein